MRVKKIGAILVGIFLFVSVGSFLSKFNLETKKSKRKKRRRELKFYFYNCPIGIQPSEIGKTPIKEIKKGIEIMEELNDVNERGKI